MSYIIKKLFLCSFFYGVSILSSSQKTINEYLKDLENPKKAALEYTTQKRLQVMQKIRDENFKKECLDVIVDKKTNELIKKELDSIKPVSSQEIQEEALKKISDYYKNEINCKHRQDIKKSNFNRRVVAVLVSMNDLATRHRQKRNIQSLIKSILLDCGQIDPQVKEQKIPKKSVPFRQSDMIGSIFQAGKIEKQTLAEITLRKNPISASAMIKEGFLAGEDHLKKRLMKTIAEDDLKSFEELFDAMKLGDKIFDIVKCSFTRNPHANNIRTFLEEKMRLPEDHKDDKNEINSSKKRKTEENSDLIDDSNFKIRKRLKEGELFIDGVCSKKHYLENQESEFESEPPFGKEQKTSSFDPAKYENIKIYLR
ncbi:MAG: hypothetical protein ACXWL5_03770 [Candidatus Chromulinivorax sp.]